MELATATKARKKTSSLKAKGRNLQKTVRDVVLETFHSLTPDDVRSTSMGCGGVDVQLSTRAGNLWPFCVECKNVENFQLWKSLEQAEVNATDYNAHKSSKARNRHALLVFKKNFMPVFACIRHDAIAAQLQDEIANKRLISPKHHRDRLNVWSHIEAFVCDLKGKARTAKMETFACSLARPNTPTYVILPFKVFMRLAKTMVHDEKPELKLESEKEPMVVDTDCGEAQSATVVVID